MHVYMDASMEIEWILAKLLFYSFPIDIKCELN